MEISGACKRKTASAEALELVVSIRAKARAKRASHLELLRVLRDGTMTTEGQGESERSGVRLSAEGSPNEGMVSGDKAEAASGDLMDALGVQAERKKNKGERKPAGSSCA